MKPAQYFIDRKHDRMEREKTEQIGHRACEYLLCSVTYSDSCVKTYAHVLSGESIQVETIVKPPSEFRLMEEGEQIKDGDLYFSTSGTWETVPEPTVGHLCPDFNQVQYATPKTAKQKFRSIDDPWRA